MINIDCYITIHPYEDKVFRYNYGQISIIDISVCDHLKIHPFKSLSNLVDYYIYQGLDWETEALPRAREVVNSIKEYYQNIRMTDYSFNSAKL